MATPVENFGLVTVSGGYTAGATSIVLQTGDGSKLPETTDGYTYPMTWWNATDYAHPADDPSREIIAVNNRSTDALPSITRGQEGTSASAKNIPGKTYRMSLGLTKAMLESLRTPKEFFQGLQLQTHRDSDLAHKQVELVDVESIIMDDGVELRNDNGEWTGKSADISVSGAGGLDTGVEVVGSWYEIFAIAKEDGTRNLLLHKSKVWAVSTGYVSGEDASQGIRQATGNTRVSQGFVLSESGSIPYIGVKLIKTGAPTGKIWFTVETNAGGVPSGSVVATSHVYDVSRVPTTALNIRIPMKSSQVLSPSPTVYHLAAHGDWTINGTAYVSWRMDGSAGTYTGASKSTYNGTTWTADADDDLVFEVALEFDNSAVVLPSGYTKRCFLGWVLNDGSGNFVPFLQVDRSRRVAVMTAASCVAGTTNGTAEFMDLQLFVPPRHLVRATMAFTGTGSSAGLIAIGDLRATDISSLGDTTGAQTVIYAATTTTRPTEFADVMVQSLGIMAMGTVGGKVWVTGFEW